MPYEVIVMISVIVQGGLPDAVQKADRSREGRENVTSVTLFSIVAPIQQLQARRSATQILTLKIQYVRQCMVVAAEDLMCPRPGPTATPCFET